MQKQHSGEMKAPFKRLPEGNTPPMKSNPRNPGAQQLAIPAGNSKLPGQAG